MSALVFLALKEPYFCPIPPMYFCIRKVLKPLLKLLTEA
jgi:hypothetical protein